MAASCCECRIGTGVRLGDVVYKRKANAMRDYKRSTVATGTACRGSWRAQKEALSAVLSNLKY